MTDKDEVLNRVDWIVREVEHVSFKMEVIQRELDDLIELLENLDAP